MLFADGWVGVIGRLRGTLHPLDLDRVLVDVGGVGYELYVSRVSFAALPGDGSVVALEVHTHVREDAITLFGFATREEKSMFLKLLQVSGIGPKVALSVLSGMAPSELAAAIARADVKRLTQVPHVGKKLAERIVVELKDKMGNVIDLPLAAKARPALQPRGPREEALSALLNLGYRQNEAEEALAEVAEGAEVGELVKRALKGLSRAAR